MDYSKIVDIQLSGIDMRDYPDFVDTYITSAVWDDTGLDLNDSELDELNEDSEFVYECIQNKLY